jgi:toxin ParE1/3/4
MKHRLIAHAEEDLQAGVAYYEFRKHGLGIQFALEVGLGLARVLEAPSRWSVIEPGIRKYNLDRFPFAIVYRLPHAQLVEVLAIFDLRSRPGSWRDDVS